MMKGKEKILWVLYAGILVVLFLLSSTDLIIKERETEIYSIALIIEDERDENYVNFRKGIDRAAIEMHADVRFITLYNAGNSRQQMDLILREQQDGAQAIIVSPIDETQLSAALLDGQIQCPVVLVNSQLSGGNVAAAISPDYREMGEKLAFAVISEQQPEVPVYLFAGETVSGISEQFLEGISAVLHEAGYHYELFTKGTEMGFRERVEMSVAAGQEQMVIIALDQESLTEMAAILTEHWIHATYVSGLYGRGNTISILNYLDKGIITGICMNDDFSSGYLSVKMAIDAISGRISYGSMTVDSHYIKKVDLTNPDYEKKLYPIE